MKPAKKVEKGQRLVSKYFSKPSVRSTAVDEIYAPQTDDGVISAGEQSDCNDEIIPPSPPLRTAKQLKNSSSTNPFQRLQCNAYEASEDLSPEGGLTSPISKLKKQRTCLSVSVSSTSDDKLTNKDCYTSVITKRKWSAGESVEFLGSVNKKMAIIKEQPNQRAKLPELADSMANKSANRVTCCIEKENLIEHVEKDQGLKAQTSTTLSLLHKDSSCLQRGKEVGNHRPVFTVVVEKEQVSTNKKQDLKFSNVISSRSPRKSAFLKKEANDVSQCCVTDFIRDNNKRDVVNASNAPDDVPCGLNKTMLSTEDTSTAVDLLDVNWDDDMFETEMDGKEQLRATCPTVYRSVRATVSHKYHTADSLCIGVRTVGQPEEEVECHLRGSWRSLEVAEGDLVQIHASFRGRTATVDDSSGFVVTHPDILVNTTTVVGSMFCARKSVLALKFRDVEGSSTDMLTGSIVHELYQWAVQEKATESAMAEMLDRLLQRNDVLHEMYGLKLSEADMKGSVISLIPNIARWMSRHMIGSHRGTGGEVTVTAIRDIEDNYWCPRLGLKGKVDVTTEVKIHERDGSVRKRLVPLELKTGRHSFSFEHKGQVILYSLMMSERTDSDTAEGLLLYIRDGVDMQRVPSMQRDRCGLLQRRNDIAHHVSKQRCIQVDIESMTIRMPEDALPSPINSDRYCPRCPLSTVCSVFQRNCTTDTSKEISVMQPFAKESIGHLSDSHMRYFLTWCQLLDLEVLQATSDGQDCFWRDDAEKREEKGSCLSYMKMVQMHEVAPLHLDEQGVAKFHHSFKRRRSSPRKTLLTSSRISVGDRIAVSDQERTNTVCLAIGFVTLFTEDEVTLALDRNMQTYPKWQQTTFRIDQLQSTASFSICYSNLARLMSNDKKSERLRSFVIDAAPPGFRKTVPKQWVLTCHKVLKPLNDVQRRAIIRFLLCDDYLLFKGMPGTGKTTTMAALTQVLVLLGQKVLLTSYTHSALDAILLKLVQKGVSFVRLGSLNKIHDRIKEFSADFRTKALKTTQELEAFYSSQPVIATTCLGLKHPVLQRGHHFDVCIVDEASQALQPSCLGPLFYAKRFALVGDPQQLPPVIQSSNARKLGMEVSLFEKMQTAENTVTLCVQYRMNSEIMRLCNSLTYDGQLQSGSEQVSNATLTLPKIGDFSEFLPERSWLMRALSKDLSRSVVFLSTDKLATIEDLDKKGGPSNETEASIVSQLLQVLIKSGLPQNEVGIITPFRRQVQLLKKLLSSTWNVDISTIDQYQGKEKKVVIFSCVKDSAKDVSNSEILNDQRRLNVAVTRAKHKLIMIGNRRTVQKYRPFGDLLCCLRPDQLISLQPGEENLYKDIICAL